MISIVVFQYWTWFHYQTSWGIPSISNGWADSWSWATSWWWSMMMCDSVTYLSPYHTDHNLMLECDSVTYLSPYHTDHTSVLWVWHICPPTMLTILLCLECDSVTYLSPYLLITPLYLECGSVTYLSPYHTDHTSVLWVWHICPPTILTIHLCLECDSVTYLSPYHTDHNLMLECDSVTYLSPYLLTIPSVCLSVGSQLKHPNLT